MAEGAKSVAKIFIRGSVEAVWREITKTDEPIEAFFGNIMDTPGLKPGATIRMRTPPDKKFTGVVGEVIEFDPPRRFSHTFKFTDLEEAPCKVTYELRPVEGGVEFILTTEDAAPGSKTQKRMKGGESFILNTLKGMVERGKPHFMGRFILCTIACTRWMSPKKCLSTNWP